MCLKNPLFGRSIPSVLKFTFTFTLNISAATVSAVHTECVIMQKSRRSHHFMQAVDSNVAFANAAC